VLEVHRHAGRGQRAQAGALDAVFRQARVVADPGLEQVAEDVERARRARRAGEEPREGLAQRRGGDRQVQVGDEEGVRQRRSLAALGVTVTS
jgi:hypothetical protein